MSSVRVRTQPEKDGERTGLLVHSLIEITHSLSLQRGGLMFKYQSMINPSLPRRTGALHPYSSLRTQSDVFDEDKRQPKIRLRSQAVLILVASIFVPSIVKIH